MAKDTIHESVKNALIKDGWTITADPFRLTYEEFRLFADLAAERPFTAERLGRKIIVEVKTFAGLSFIKELEQALGQYKIYQDIIDELALDYELYLAVSVRIYNALFERQGAQMIVRRNRLKVLVVQIEEQRIEQWID
jgi:XisH protein